MDPLQSLAAFARTLEAGSFSAVGRELGSTQSAVSKQIASLENYLGVQLFARTTRRMQPTDEALQLYENVRQLLDTIGSIRAPGGQQSPVSGMLRVTAPSGYGRRQICPKLPRFMEQFPQVQLEILLTDQVFDLIEEGVEVAVRIGNLSPSTLMARPLGVIEHSLVATSEFLKRHGVPESPIDLDKYPCILYGGGARWSRWEFESETGRHAVEVKGTVRIDDPEAMYELVRAHQGIALIPDWVLGGDIEAGRVKWLLQDFYPIPQPVNIVYPQTRFLTKRARSFIDFLLAEKARSAGSAARAGGATAAGS